MTVEVKAVPDGELMGMEMNAFDVYEEVEIIVDGQKLDGEFLRLKKSSVSPEPDIYKVP
jgi:hypothetical protein